MAHWAKVGVKCVCVHESSRKSVSGGQASPFATFPRVGEIYTVRKVEVELRQQWLFFDEIANPSTEYKQGKREPSFWSENFRPVQSTTTAVEALKRQTLGTGKAVEREEEGA